MADPHSNHGVNISEFPVPQQHPLLTELGNKTESILNVFGNLPTEIQMDGLDMLQHVVNAVMQKITAGRVTAVKFVPVEGLAVTNDNQSLQLLNDSIYAARVKQEPLDQDLVPEQEKNNSDSMNKQPADSQDVLTSNSIVSTPEHVNKTKNKSTKKQKTSQPIAAKKSPKKSKAKTMTNTQAVEPQRKRKKKSVQVTVTEEGAEIIPTKKSLGNVSQKDDTLDRTKDVKSKHIAAENTTKHDLLNTPSNDSIKVNGLETIGSIEEKEAQVFVKTEVDSDTDCDNAITDNGPLNSSTEEHKNYAVRAYNVMTPRVPCNPEVLALLQPEMRLLPEEKRRKRVARTVAGKFQCNMCTYSTDTKFHFDAHLIVHTKEKKFACKICDKVFTAAGSLKRHTMAHEGLKPHQCPICSSHFIDLSALRIHSVVHTGEKLYKCDKCEKMYTNSANLSRHRRVHTGETPYACKVPGCDVKYRDLSSLKLHNLKHTGEKPYACEFCGMKFKTSSDYLRHKRSHTNERNYECEICGKKFIQGWHLKQHLRMHADLRPWSCNLCDKKFRSKASLQHHTRWHQGVKDYQCEICYKQFSTKKYLESHQVIHTNAKPFACKTCGSQFNQVSNLRRHQLIHSDVKKYKCSFCLKAFKYINSWRYHEGTHTGSKHTCEKCGMSFKSPQGRQKHKCATTSLEDMIESPSKMDSSFESFLMESSQEAGDTDLEDLDEEERKEILESNLEEVSKKVPAKSKTSEKKKKKHPSIKIKLKLGKDSKVAVVGNKNKRKQGVPKKTTQLKKSLKISKDKIDKNNSSNISKDVKIGREGKEDKEEELDLTDMNNTSVMEKIQASSNEISVNFHHSNDSPVINSSKNTRNYVVMNDSDEVVMKAECDDNEMHALRRKSTDAEKLAENVGVNITATHSVQSDLTYESKDDLISDVKSEEINKEQGLEKKDLVSNRPQNGDEDDDGDLSGDDHNRDRIETEIEQFLGPNQETIG